MSEKRNKLEIQRHGWKHLRPLKNLRIHKITSAKREELMEAWGYENWVKAPMSRFK